ncbi:unnamed protein product, partial [Brugia timori]|uniref:Uncharacterized protein n=1 Tax=Brugia timori TaxID=42155 RepID=A0A0R3QGW1_9BILA
MSVVVVMVGRCDSVHHGLPDRQGVCTYPCTLTQT